MAVDLLRSGHRVLLRGFRVTGRLKGRESQDQFELQQSAIECATRMRDAGWVQVECFAVIEDWYDGRQVEDEQLIPLADFEARVLQ